jgi:hypothetical protein
MSLEDDVYFYMDDIAKQTGKPEMMESLRLIVEDMIVDLRTRQPELFKDVTSTDVLLALANQGFVRFEGVAPVDEPDKYVWGATPDLFDCLGTGGYGVVKRTNRRRSKIRMDASLTELQNKHRRMFKLLGTRFTTKQQKRKAMIFMLLEDEKHGYAIPYKDDDGRLAWKASERLQREITEQ